MFPGLFTPICCVMNRFSTCYPQAGNRVLHRAGRLPLTFACRFGTNRRHDHRSAQSLHEDQTAGNAERLGSSLSHGIALPQRAATTGRLR
ncbi:hypothetical protein BQ8794_150064 [Mesorhizobium prunaredense]|uniref:Uncharacterized protein n=1 Tax=Mesorhizobium prunaredense TaxID=1631249 RepID=A0A1R3V390_9HYPH|nr:hypothetical protein BQ8794_150064 [Mesorhizobium prunaredense]